jgi:hypothetical protein
MLRASFARRRGRGENLLRRAGSLPAQDVADHDGRRSPSGPAPAPARESHGCAIWAKGLLWQGFNCRKASGQEKCDAWDTAGRLSPSPFTQAASASSGDRSSSAGRLNGGNVSAAMAAIAARRLNSCSVMALFLRPAQCVIIQPVGQLRKFQLSLRTENFPIPILGCIARNCAVPIVAAR